MTTSTITVRKSCTVAEGPHAITLFHLLALVGALKLEQLGMTRRGRSALSIAKATTGLGTSDRAAQIIALEFKIDGLRSQIAYVQQTDAQGATA